MATKWQNNDGLVQYFGTRTVETERTGMVGGVSHERELVLDVTWDQINAGVGPVAADGGQVFIPAGSFIESAIFQVQVAFTSGGAPTLNIGTAELDGSVIDVDGIDDSIAMTAIDAVGDQVDCDGLLIGAVTDLTKDSYITMADEVATYTAGAARLVIKYIPNALRSDAGIPATV